MFGPLGSYAIGAERGWREVGNGNYYRGVEYMMPSGLRNAMRGLRFMTDGGAMTLKGDEITTDLNAWNKVMQMAGFAPSSLSDLYMRRSFASEKDSWLQARKSDYLTAIYAAHNAEDFVTKRELKRKLLELGRRYPGLVDAKTVDRSITARNRAMEEDLSGLRMSKAGEREAREVYGIGGN